MKTFNQFLNECYLSEAPADRVKSPKEQAEWDKINKKEEDAKKRKAQKGLTGAAADPTKQFKKQGTTTNVSGSDVRGEPTEDGAIVKAQEPGKLAKIQKSDNITPKSSASVVDTSVKPVDVEVLNTKPKALPSGASSAAKEAEKAAAKTATKATGKGILKGLGRVVGPASAALDVADERSKGSGWLRSLAKGAVVAAGGAAGGAAGSVAGPVGTVVGAGGGSIAASKAFDTVAGANAKERKAIATTNRQSQSGGAVKGIGGPTSFSQKKPGGAAFISTGSGPQRRTAQLAKTSVVTGPGGKQEVGNLAFKDGKAVYKRADTKSLAQTSSNPLERIGRSLFAGAYKDNDAKLAATKLATARSSDATRNQKLGVKLKPGG
jgi:hypothetical protein